MPNDNDNIGRAFGNRYIIERRIARGGMADVYLARDQLLDRPVALKVLFPELSTDPSFVERFRREAQNAAKLSHPNIVSVFDWGEDESTYFIVMEYVDGRTLSNIVKQDGPLNARSAANIGSEIAAALGFAHRNGVVHRDVKPGNVIINKRGLVKVTDFGIARARNTSENLTQTGAVMGTATYFSPEQAQGHGVDQRSDVYSLGVLLFELVGGRPPFQGDNPVSIAYKHVREAPPQLQSLRPDIPRDYTTIVSRALAKAPANRYQTAEELREHLLRFLNNQPVGAPPPATALMGHVPEGVIDPTQVVAASATRNGTKDKSLFGPMLLVLLLLATAIVGAFAVWKSISNSDANKPITVAGVKGKPFDDAQRILKEQGFNVTRNDRTSTDKQRGQVIDQNPQENATANKGDTVTLTVGSGPDAISIGNYEGLSRTQAEGQVRGLNLIPIIQYEPNDSVAVDTVIKQSPPASSEVPPGSQVTLTVSKGKETVEVPDVSLTTVTDAKTKLGNLGFEVAYPRGTRGNDVVDSTDPASGTKLPKGSRVTLNIEQSSEDRTTSTSTTTTSTTPDNNSDSSSRRSN